ncbi:MAG: radical SAM protein [Nitrospirae bacterium]|nr:MAG: radical SAM protein [Nitrospirota bacterium]
MSDYQALAEKALRDEPLTRAECLHVLGTPDERLLELLDAGFTVRERYFGRKVRLQLLQNAKSGACQEDCHYCSQSAVSTADIDRYGLLPMEQMVDGARRAAAARAQRYCIVISGRSPLDREIAEISDAVRAIKRELPIQVCCSLGLLNQDQARELRAAGVDRINHNLNTSPVPGTPLEHCDHLTPQRCLKVLCLFRFLHPRTEIRMAGGREFNLRTLQPLALYVADSLFVGGYLTTPGQPAPEAWKMITDLGFEIEVDYRQPVAK